MKAAVCYEFGKQLKIEDLEIDPPKKGEVKVRLAATAICHSDIHALRGEGSSNVPVVFGHEAAGIVEEVEESVTLTKPGDRVAVSLLRSCGRCFYCTLGFPHLCEGSFALNKESRLRNKRGEVVHQGLRTGAFAEYCVVDQSQVVPVPENLPFDRAALLTCGVITGLGAVVNTAQVKPGSSVVVIGTGGVGLNAVQGAVLAGAHPIIAIDLLDKKLNAARSFGATQTVNAAAEKDVEQAVKGFTSGRGADYVFVTVGSAAAVSQALGLTRRRGSVILVGLPAPGATASLEINPFVRGEQRILGSFMGSTRPSSGIPRLIDLYQHGRLKLDELITARYPLERINEAIEAVEKGEALRNVILFD
ncbi:MAG: Zn-dependent alcohol dehydrogenase [Deltaproteobacteria bacterium]|nr:Zn-dependent alcohol dehydrogenase [Deltaproteobacteria bacterium]